jgi:hypothetical protein
VLGEIPSEAEVVAALGDFELELLLVEDDAQEPAHRPAVLLVERGHLGVSLLLQHPPQVDKNQSQHRPDLACRSMAK